MDEVVVTVRLPRALWDASRRLADHRGESVDAVMQRALELVLHAPTAVPPALSSEFESARSWQELQGRLMVKGFVLRDDAGTLVLLSHPEKLPLCDLAALGQDDRALTQRFGLFPGRAHRQLAERLMAKRVDRAARLAEWDVLPSRPRASDQAG
ncbi:hypothetical protein [Tropicibacter naphthalenivorans]|uniref:Uncharacterized protein n=1 Tax=Tropicibacter naphthalenivorans TaxID=441103 RepID=A0A0P1FZQ3_9RHOB|nr:hypothetical protein [Tropicibacter naphthalenivorans]CUH74758.1 hypothetical protein TRN7648_00069 [Tropicibacter naphthalenivorans]SMC49290.1 hypothetical protein SAMN04488093_101811 [Tropicibacter naphthalenivorans]